MSKSSRKSYSLELVLIDQTDNKSKEISRRALGEFADEKDAQLAMELVELADPEHIISI